MAKLWVRPRLVILTAWPNEMFRFTIFIPGDFLKWPSVGQCHCVMISSAFRPCERGASEHGFAPALPHWPHPHPNKVG